MLQMRAIEPFYTLSPYNAAEGLVLLSGMFGICWIKFRMHEAIAHL